MATTQLAYIPDHKERAKLRLLIPWRKPKIMALVKSLAEGAQLIEDINFDMISSCGIEHATGHCLDQWGETVGEPRLGLSDNEYRGFIKARILINKCNSTTDEILEVAELIAAPVISVTHYDNLPAGFYLTITRETWTGDNQRRRVKRMLEDIRPGGRHMTIFECIPASFGFDGDPSAAGYSVGPFSRLL